ncbi:hypothetical protein Dimus_000171 [Dionaea muscipula]
MAFLFCSVSSSAKFIRYEGSLDFSLPSHKCGSSYHGCICYKLELCSSFLSSCSHPCFQLLNISVLEDRLAGAHIGKRLVAAFCPCHSLSHNLSVRCYSTVCLYTPEECLSHQILYSLCARVYIYASARRPLQF